jgi:glycosyltransferase involved in cell wall biosynthesis
MSEPYLSLILPAYNEAGRIRQAVEMTQAHLDRRQLAHEILVVADGDDGTREIVRDMARTDPRLHVHGSPGRHGKGHGIRLGVAHASGHVIGFCDADYKVPIEEIDKLLPLLEQGADVVIGSRRGSGARVEKKQPLYRRLGSLAFARVVRLLIGLGGIRDTQCGFKFFRGEVARDLFGRQRIDGYMFDVEVLYLAVRAGYRIREVGVRWQDDGDSRSQPVWDNLKYLKDILNIRFGGAGGLRGAGQTPATNRRTAA